MKVTTTDTKPAAGKLLNNPYSIWIIRKDRGDYLVFIESISQIKA